MISESDNMQCRTKDGMQITINVSYQYKLVQELTSVIDLLKKWGEDNYKMGFTRIAKNVLRTAVSTFEVSEIVFSRSDVDKKLRDDLDTELEKEGVTVDNFQLLDIKFPSEYELAISDTQNEQLKIDIAKNEQNKTKELLEGLESKVDTDKEIIKTNYLVNTIKDVTLIKQNKISLKNFVGGAGDYLLEKKNVYGITDLAKFEIQEALKKAYSVSKKDEKFTYLLDAPLEVTNLLNKT